MSLREAFAFGHICDQLTGTLPRLLGYIRPVWVSAIYPGRLMLCVYAMRSILPCQLKKDSWRFRRMGTKYHSVLQCLGVQWAGYCILALKGSGKLLLTTGTVTHKYERNKDHCDRHRGKIWHRPTFRRPHAACRLLRSKQHLLRTAQRACGKKHLPFSKFHIQVVLFHAAS